VTFQAQFDEIGDAERVGDWFSNGVKLTLPNLNVDLGVGTDILEPIRVRSARRGNVVVAFHLLELERRYARQTRLAPNGGQEHHHAGGTESASVVRHHAGVETPHSVVDGLSGHCSLHLRKRREQQNQHTADRHRVDILAETSQRLHRTCVRTHQRTNAQDGVEPEAHRDHD